MKQVINVSNALSPFDEIFGEFEISGDRRGWSQETFVPTEFKLPLSDELIKPLSVNQIANANCPTGRDLYISKGKKKPLILPGGRSGDPSFERSAGVIGENYFTSLFKEKIKKVLSYNELKHLSDDFTNKFINSNKEKMEALRIDYNDEVVDFFISSLKSGGRIENIIDTVNQTFSSGKTIKESDIIPKEKLNPDLQLGLSQDSEPDFVIPTLGIIGDIKSGESLKKKHLLTAAGYALAYENYKRKPIDWGMIYFFKASNFYGLGKQISLPQVYLFPIDDQLRDHFTEARNDALSIIVSDNIPDFPKADNRKQCLYCKFKSFCVDKGLVL